MLCWRCGSGAAGSVTGEGRVVGSFVLDLRKAMTEREEELVASREANRGLTRQLNGIAP